MKALAVDLCCGLGGWSEGLLAEGWDVVGFDVERHRYGDHQYPAQLVLQDILTLTGGQFRGKVSLIVASPPCQFFSYCAMPWRRAKALASVVRADPARLEKELALFRACERIAKEAECPIVIENVRGAIPWVGRSRWNFGSFHLWGDVPALMPHINKRTTLKAAFSHQPGGMTIWEAYREREARKHGGDWFSDPTCPSRQGGQVGRKHRGSGEVWFDTGPASLPSNSPRRKAASAMIAKIPEPLARHIARVYRP